MPRLPALAKLADLRLLAGVTCLDFANTVEPRTGRVGHDYLRDYTDIVRWAAHAHVIDISGAALLNTEARRRPRAAAEAFEQTIALREAIYGAFSSIARGESVLPAQLRGIEAAYAEGLSNAQLVASSVDGFQWQYKTSSLNLPMWLLANSAVQTLTSGRGLYVRQCPGAGDCGWLFLDATRSHTRRWCRADGCGARVKMRNRYGRLHATG
jgi:predicted RNA-binding Zn ribbon-like protein